MECDFESYTEDLIISQLEDLSFQQYANITELIKRDIDQGVITCYGHLSLATKEMFQPRYAAFYLISFCKLFICVPRSSSSLNYLENLADYMSSS